MSLFFDNTQSVNVSFTVKSLPEKNGFDTVLVGKDIWMRFEQSGRDRLGLSIRPIRPLRKSVLKREPLRELTCWAILDEEVGYHILSLSELKIYVNPGCRTFRSTQMVTDIWPYILAFHLPSGPSRKDSQCDRCKTCSRHRYHCYSAFA
jgi:hypothetical protein